MVDVLGRYSKHSYLRKQIEEWLKIRDRPRKVVTRPPRQIQRRLKPDEVFDLLAAYEDGVTVLELAKLFRIHRATVSLHLKRAGATYRYGKIDRNIREATKLYEMGWSLAKVGEHFNVEAGTVWRALKKTGVKMRSTSDQG